MAGANNASIRYEKPSGSHALHLAVISMYMTQSLQYLARKAGAATILAAPQEDADRMGVDPYIRRNLCPLISTRFCMPQEPLPNSHLNLLRVSEWKCKFGWLLSLLKYYSSIV